jgi:hypothetical protein
MKIIITFLLCLSALVVQAQFPYIPGKTGNGSFGRYYGGGLSYDFGASRAGFAYSSNTDKLSNNGVYGYPDFTTFTINAGAAVNQNTFTLYQNGLKPGGDISLDFAKTWESTRNDSLDDVNSKQYFFRVVLQTKELKFLDTVATAYASISRTAVDIGLNTGYTYRSQRVKEANARTYFSAGIFFGYSFNQSGSFKEKEIESILATNGSTRIIDSEKRYIGAPSNILTGKVFIDWGKRLWKMNDAKYPATDVHQKAVYLLARFHPEFPEFNISKWNAVLGVSINQYTNFVLGAVMFEFAEVGNNSFKDAFTARLYVGVPLKK